MKRNLKEIITLLIFLTILILSFAFIDRLLSDKSIHGTIQARDMYIQPSNTIDVVFMGSSHVHCDINTALLWQKYGIAGYDYSAAEQPLWITYHYLKEICKYQKPKLIVLDMFSPARFKENYQYTWLSESLQGMRFSWNKASMLLASCELDKLPDYFPDIVSYHSRYSGLTTKDIQYLLETKENREAFKGYTPYWGTSPQMQPNLTQKSSGAITVKSEEYLQKIIDYTKDNEIELFLIVSPYVTTSSDELVYNRVHEIADMNNISFNSTNYAYEKMNLDFATDFVDDSHLNYWGSCKYTEYLGEEIKNNYDIPDRRGLAEWESWDRHYNEIEAQKANMQLSSTNYQ